MRKLFPCGHRGKGQYCHRCEDERGAAVQEAERAQMAEARRERAEQLMNLQASQRERAERAARHKAAALAKQAEEEALRIAEAPALRQHRQELSEQDVINLDHLPPAVRDKARILLDRVRRGCPLVEVGGKRLLDRSLISVPIGHRWRLVLRETGAGFVPLEAMSHEKYNHICGRMLP